jgi:hypothetical protein
MRVFLKRFVERRWFFFQASQAFLVEFLCFALSNVRY